MDTISKLTELFKEFPGIGPRQARRFVYFLLSRNSGYIESLAKLFLELQREIKNCPECFRYFPNENPKITLCTACRDTTRDKTSLMIVPRDVDLEAIEKSHVYNGYYFVLGGTVPILEKEPERRIRLKELFARSQARAQKGLAEIIIASSLNPEGENTAEFVARALTPLATEYGIKVSGLGRGLSTGTELEYSDAETIKNALKNRS